MQRRSTSSQIRTSGTRARSDAVSMLMEDHKKVQKLFRDFEKAHDADDSEACQQIVQRACAELEVHTTLEEELFYPAAREALGEEDEELIDEAEVEHQSAKELIAQLGAMVPDDQKYAATFTVLAEYVKHHIKEEERELFPKVKKAKLDIDSLGEEMKAQKRVLTEEKGLSDEAEEPGHSRATVHG
jgi:hemerythrin-like domain-containing protein